MCGCDCVGVGVIVWVGVGVIAWMRECGGGGRGNECGWV